MASLLENLGTFSDPGGDRGLDTEMHKVRDSHLSSEVDLHEK